MLLLATVALAVKVAWPYADNVVKIGHGVAYYERASLVAPDRVRLPSPGEADWAGRFELAWDGGYGEIGAIVSRGSGFVVRAFTPRRGTLAPNTPVRVDTYVYQGDPGPRSGWTSRTSATTTSSGTSRPGTCAAAGTTWLVFVHGHNGYPEEALRYLPALHAADMPVLVPTYRNDVGAPASPDGVSHLGDTSGRTSPPQCTGRSTTARATSSSPAGRWAGRSRCKPPTVPTSRTGSGASCWTHPYSAGTRSCPARRR